MQGASSCAHQQCSAQPAAFNGRQLQCARHLLGIGRCGPRWSLSACLAQALQQKDKRRLKSQCWMQAPREARHQPDSFQVISLAPYLPGCSGVRKDQAAYALASRVSILPPGAGVCRGRTARVTFQLDVREHVKHLHTSISGGMASSPVADTPWCGAKGSA